MGTVTAHPADTDAPILDVLAERWSTRVFDPTTPIDEAALASALEAARWAPSASNTQPWRLIIGRRGTAAHAAIFDALMGFNQAWAGSASALIVFAAETDLGAAPADWAVYDTGQAAAHFSVQAQALGLRTHQMGGFHRDRISAAFALPASVVPMTVMAVGVMGDPSLASEALQAREKQPRTRREMSEIVLVTP
ncbi:MULTISPECIES: nitroreductase family protein [unclassified Microbacterium]|uniref:nitroreductase family protein n=1 Tax=unclassified Microbacterium TaxID=2609290 RepID=UPI00301A518E